MMGIRPAAHIAQVKRHTNLLARIMACPGGGSTPQRTETTRASTVPQHQARRHCSKASRVEMFPGCRRSVADQDRRCQAVTEAAAEIPDQACEEPVDHRSIESDLRL